MFVCSRTYPWPYQCHCPARFRVNGGLHRVAPRTSCRECSNIVLAGTQSFLDRWSWRLAITDTMEFVMVQPPDKLALVTGASTGIGYFLAQECANHGYNLIVAADEARIEKAAEQLREVGVEVQAVEADLATVEGVDRLYAAADGRPIDLLLANAGRGLGGDFLEQDFAEARRVVPISSVRSTSFGGSAARCDR